MVKLVLIVGAGAVGKMTVGQELMKITNLRLFHNHMMIEPVIEIFGKFKGDTILKLREVIFNDFVNDDYEGMIHTLMWAFDMKSDWEYVDNLVVIDDSIVRGTTLKQSILRILDRLGPKKIVVASSAPQIRYPDCYGIDMSRLNEFIAFNATIELLKE